MYGQVKRLRRHGKRLSDDEISRDPGILGELRASRDPTTGTTYLGLYEWGNPVGAALCPKLLNPKVSGVNNNLMRLEGWERLDGDGEYATTVMQEWVINWLDRPGPAGNSG